MPIEPASAWGEFMAAARARVAQPQALEARGTLTRLTGLVLEAAGLRVPVGAQCQMRMPGQEPVLAEVVGFAGDKAFLMPAGDIHGLSSGASVTPAAPYVPAPRLGAAGGESLDTSAGVLRLPVGAGLLGRVVDSQGQPLDHGGPLAGVTALPMDRSPINAMERDPVREPLDTGVRAINALLTVGRGQRLGLFAGSGVGKSVLLGMMARYTRADVIVVGLIGERGREVKEFVEDILGAQDRGRSVVVAAPADASPLLRMQGAAYATAIAEHFRDQGLHVLLLMDSLTRYAMAQREIALAIGEPPATKGYPPSCFAKLPALVERSGNGLNGVGSITAFYTVLSEGDDQQDPIADAARAILDGHIVLSRALAEGGHYPAIDIEQSASRVMHNVVQREHFDMARSFRAIYSRYQKSRDLIQVGAYMSGSDPQLDEAIRLQPGMVGFLQQSMFEAAPMDDCLAAMGQVLEG
ncbi:MAG: flagellar protein export ATPase FliI [Alicycliphilus sp.]|uniref:Flagellum-specific ATP synthase n=1 Tax=Diaphorobacter limosus TaxID=3036128 RepID=A0ABZ0IZ02_9BURK|nr:flagellar protein export ATPase FliI [Diaphorobacter sp. Y-1]MBP7325739.1 flagellar protein export ATPase FliI [Alicycliphilus sp.]MBP7328670.1 flagellar protein export ATPase FliI [Alicycliphilus sp.]MBP8779458.1 flagellar protein export ATPase FliI [Alicycliphilus sp.]TXJ17427.1 MAG: flagellar protein export ATPase FliI [Alicycliphilus sp.]WOO30788.1 flagellar protein export ATPase FliI [Diaphorobacter sp. Y-1]